VPRVLYTKAKRTGKRSLPIAHEAAATAVLFFRAILAGKLPVAQRAMPVQFLFFSPRPPTDLQIESAGRLHLSLRNLLYDDRCPIRPTPVEIFECKPIGLWRVTLKPLVRVPIEFAIIAPNTGIEDSGKLEHFIQSRHVRAICRYPSVSKPETSSLAHRMCVPVGAVISDLFYVRHVVSLEFLRHFLQSPGLFFRELEAGCSSASSKLRRFFHQAFEVIARQPVRIVDLQLGLAMYQALKLMRHGQRYKSTREYKRVQEDTQRKVALTTGLPADEGAGLGIRVVKAPPE
jgi:hypothetical protein